MRPRAAGRLGPVCALLGALGAAGCDGSIDVPVDAAADEADRDRDAASPEAADDEGPPATDAYDAAAPPPDWFTSPDVERDLPSAALPANLAPARLIVPGPLSLVGDGTTSCTNAVAAGPVPDRWCAFRRLGAGAQTTELWVIDVTKAGAGPPPACDGSSPDCLRLTANLWTDEPILGPRQRVAQRFEGDTLFFHADALSKPDAPYSGPIYAWRPGWPHARTLATQAYACYGHARLPLALCIDGLVYDAAVPVEYDLRAGDLSDPAGGVLALVDHLRGARANRQRAPRVGFSDDGQFLVYTSAPVVDFPTPALLVARHAGGAFVPGPAIAPDAMDWAISLDSTTIYFLSGYSDGTGLLTTADFPSGEHLATSTIRADSFFVLGGPDRPGRGVDRGVGFFKERGGRFLSEYRRVPDRKALSESYLVFRYTNPLEGFQVSRDGRFTAYAKGDPDQGFNGYLVRSDGSEECILNSEQNRPAFEYSFLDNSRLVFWSEESPDDPDRQDGWLGDPAGCRDKRFFAPHVAFTAPIGNDGIVFGDGLDLARDTFTLRYAAFEQGAEWPADGAVPIQEQATYPVAFLPPGLETIVFATAPAGSAGGLFVFGPLPFQSTARSRPAALARGNERRDTARRPRGAGGTRLGDPRPPPDGR